MRLRTFGVPLLLSGTLALAACGDAGPVAEGANNFEAAEVDVLPPDESVATSNQELANGFDEPPVEVDDAAGNSGP